MDPTSNTPHPSPREVRRSAGALGSDRPSEVEDGGRAVGAAAEAILAAVVEGILVYDRDGRIVRSNAAADEILGAPAEERDLPAAEPGSAAATWHREDGAALAPDELPAVRAIRGGEACRGVPLRLRRAGLERWLSVGAEPLVVGGARVGAIVTLSDLTERKRREANQALLAGVADDFARFATEEEITGAVGARLAQHLGVTSCTVADVAEGVARVRAAFSGPGAIVPAVPMKVSEYLDEELQAAARAGRTVVIRDTHADARARAERYDALRVRAGIIVPLQRDGEWRHSLAVGCPEPRDWRPDQVQVLEEVASRLFPRIERARAEEEVRRSEARARTISHNVRDLLVVLHAVRDAAGALLAWRYADANDATLELLGRRREDVIGRTIAEVLPDRGEAVSARLARVVASGAPEQYERTFAGRTLLVKLFRIAADQVGSAAVDITERKRAEIALRESEERFRILADAMPQIVCVLRPDGSAEYVNPEWTAFSGLDLAGTRRAGWQGFLHPDDVAAALACRRRALKTLAAQDVEVRYRAADGAFRWFLCRLAPIAEGGRVAWLVGAGMDIDDRKRAEAEARSLAQFPSENPNPVLRASTAGGVLYANGPAEEMLGRMGWRAGDPLPDALLEAARRVPAVGTILQHEVTTIQGQVWSFTLSASAGEGHVNLFGLDVTHQRQAEQALREADRRKDEFLGMLSHELRNPLAPIRTALFILDRAEPGGEQARRAKEVASRQVGHITRLVDDLLDVTRIRRGKIELRRAEVDLAALARRTADDYRAMLDDRGLALAVELPAAPVPVHGDETRLAQVLGNLLSNAAKFTPNGGRVRLAVAAEAGRAVVHVRDSGPGISPDVLPTLFEPFTQAKQTLARTEGGLGLGLSLVKGLVELHGGEVAASGGADGGADFTVTLPLALPATPSAGPPGPAPSPATAGGHRRRVLVVDDNRDAAESLAELVRMLGHDVELAFDGPSAVARAAQTHPDLVLCDIGLPGMDGYEVAQALRASHGRPLRLVALSGYAQPEDVARALEAGFDRHVAKPPDPANLGQLLA